MGTIFQDGNITTTSSEQNIFDVTGEAHYSFYIFCDAMVAGDKIQIKIYVYDSEDTTYRVIETIPLEGAQPDPAYFYSFLPNQQYKVTIQRILGTDRNYSWQRHEVT